MSRQAGGGPGPNVALGVLLVVVFTAGVLSVGVKSGVEDAARAHLSANPDTFLAPAPPQGAPQLAEWGTSAALAMDGITLAAAGIDVPEGANVFAARIFGGGTSPAYRFYEAGGGAFSENFYPASAVKLLAALGALDFVASLGFTGAVTIDGGYTLREIYDSAIRWSSNEDANQLVRIAGIDRLNLQFLPVNGYRSTTIQEAFDGWDGVAYSPPMVLSEGDRVVEVPEREGMGSYGCDGETCSTLFELADAVRRVVLDTELPLAERFAIAPADVAALQDALLGAEGWIGPGVEKALGPGALVFSKPGYVGGLDCVDDALVAAPVSGHRYLIALSVPDYEGCEVLAPLAAQVLTVLDGYDDGAALRSDGSIVDVVNGNQVGS